MGKLLAVQATPPPQCCCKSWQGQHTSVASALEGRWREGQRQEDSKNSVVGHCREMMTYRFSDEILS